MPTMLNFYLFFQIKRVKTCHQLNRKVAFNKDNFRVDRRQLSIYLNEINGC